MNRNIILPISALSIVALILFNKSLNLSDEVTSSFQILQSVETDGVLLNDLKNRWENKRHKKKILRFLKNYKPRPKVRTRGDKTTFSFPEMTKSTFDRLSKKILQSTLKIYKFEVEQVDKFNVKLILEVER